MAVFVSWAAFSAHGQQQQNSIKGLALEAGSNLPVSEAAVMVQWKEANPHVSKPQSYWISGIAPTDGVGQFTIRPSDVPCLLRIVVAKTDPINGDELIGEKIPDIEVPRDKPMAVQVNVVRSKRSNPRGGASGSGSNALRIRLIRVAAWRLAEAQATPPATEPSPVERAVRLYFATEFPKDLTVFVDTLQADGTVNTKQDLFTAEPKGCEAPGGKLTCGTLRFGGLPAGRYVVRLDAPGSEEQTFFAFLADSGAPALVLPDGQMADTAAKPIRFQPMLLGLSGERVVSGASQVVNLEAAQRVIWTSEDLTALPLAGIRNVDTLALLAPGVFLPPATPSRRGPGIAPGVGTSGEFSMNGLRSRDVNFTLDGSDNNDEETGVRRQGFVSPFPESVESLEDFHVITALADVRYPRSISGQVNAVSQAGSSEWHGTAYGFLTWDRLNAHDYFETGHSSMSELIPITSNGLMNGRPVTLQLNPGYPSPYVAQNGLGFTPNSLAKGNRLTRTQSGIALGGPAGKWGTSIFGSYEFQQQRSVEERHFLVPTFAQRGVFGSGATGLIGSKGGPTLLPANPLGDAIFSLYPLPNNPLGPFGGNTYTAALPADANADVLSLRLDQPFRAGKDHAAVRYNRSVEDSILPVTSGAIYSSMRPRFRTQNIAGYWNTTLSSRWANSFSASVGFTNGHFDEVRDPALLPSKAFPHTPFLLNARMFANLSSPERGPLLASPDAFPFDVIDPRLGNIIGMSRQHEAATESITGPLGQIELPGFSGLGWDTAHFPQTRADRTRQMNDIVTWQQGPHFWRAGIELRRIRLDSFLEQNARPLFSFDGLENRGASTSSWYVPQGGGNGATDIRQLDPLTLAALGKPTGIFQTLEPSSGDTPFDLSRTQIDLFGLHERRLRPNLNVTIGGRLQITRLPLEVGHRLQDSFDLAKLTSLAEDAAQKGSQASTVTTPFGTVTYFPFTDLVSGMQNIFPASFRDTYGANSVGFEPRVGFSWNPGSSPGTVLRGGWGIYRGVFPAIIVDEARSAFPDYLPVNVASSALGVTELAIDQFHTYYRQAGIIQSGTLNRLSNGANPILDLIIGPASSGPFLHGIFDPISPDIHLVQPAPHLRNAYSFQQGLTIEHSFGRSDVLSVSYIGTLGRRLLRVTTPLGSSDASGITFNGDLSGYEPYPSTGSQVVSPEKKSISGLVTVSKTLFESSASSSYHSLQAEWRRRLEKGISFGMSFTYAHAIDEVSDFFDMAGAFALPQDSHNLRQDRGSANFDARYRVGAQFVIDTSFLTKARVWNSFQLAGVYMAQQGQPFTVNSNIDVNGDGNLTDRLNTTSGINRAPTGRGETLALVPGVPAGSLLATPGHDGAVGRNTFRAPGSNNLDIALTYRLLRRERANLLLRSEMFNVMNRADFGMPVRILESPGFGKSYFTSVPPRTVQLALKWNF